VLESVELYYTPIHQESVEKDVVRRRDHIPDCFDGPLHRLLPHFRSVVGLYHRSVNTLGLDHCGWNIERNRKQTNHLISLPIVLNVQFIFGLCQPL
jgi:hypothetical protein